MSTHKERLGVSEQALPGYVLNLAIKLKSMENAFLPTSVYQVLEKIPSPHLAFSELNLAQQAVVIKFLEEVLPQVDMSEYQELMPQPAA